MLHRMLDESGLRIGGLLTDLFGLSGRNLLDGLVAGQDPEQMVAGVKGNARKKIPALLDALGCGLDDGAKPRVALLRDMQEAVERSLADMERRIVEAAEQDYELPWTLLQTLPGTGPLAAATLLAEVGDDMEAFGAATGELGRHLSGQPRVSRQERGREAARGQRVPAADPVRDRPRGGAHAWRAVRAVQAASDEAARRRQGGRGDGAQDPAYRVRDAARQQAVLRSADRLPGAHGDQEQGSLAEYAAQGEPAAGCRQQEGGRAAARRGGRRQRRAAVGGSRAASGLNRGGGRVHGKKRERRGKHAYRARRPPSSRA